VDERVVTAARAELRWMQFDPAVAGILGGCMRAPYIDDIHWASLYQQCELQSIVQHGSTPKLV
jgi:hypothetical protein